MLSFWKMIWVDIKLFLREPIAAFFTLAFPVMMLLLFGSIYGNKPSILFGGFGSVDILIPGYISMIIASTGLLSLTISLSSYREQGVLRRFEVTPIGPFAFMSAQIIVLFLMTTFGITILITVGKIVYGIKFWGNLFVLFFAYVLSCLSIFSLGFILASILPTVRTSQAVGSVLFYPMIFLSGSTIPTEVLPITVQSFSKFLPLTYVVKLLRGLWTGESIYAHFLEIIVLISFIILGVVISIKFFRWK